MSYDYAMARVDEARVEAERVQAALRKANGELALVRLEAAALKRDLDEAREALRRIEPFLPSLDDGPVRFTEHAQAAGFVRAVLAKGQR